ncbi:MAG: hypothetical protein VX619_00760 [bacterium]|nr:hypothetical protein [bacterium]
MSMSRLNSDKSSANLYIIVMKSGYIHYYGNPNKPFHVFQNRIEAESYIHNHSLGHLWTTTEATQEILADYFTGSI